MNWKEIMALIIHENYHFFLGPGGYIISYIVLNCCHTVKQTWG